MLQTVTKTVIIGLGLVGQFVFQASLQLLQVILLTLNGQLLAFCLFSACKSIIIKFLLEIVHCILQLLSLLIKGIACVIAFFLKHKSEILAEIILCHQRINLNVGDFNS